MSSFGPPESVLGVERCRQRIHEYPLIRLRLKRPRGGRSSHYDLIFSPRKESMQKNNSVPCVIATSEIYNRIVLKGFCVPEILCKKRIFSPKLHSTFLCRGWPSPKYRDRVLPPHLSTSAVVPATQSMSRQKQRTRIGAPCVAHIGHYTMHE
jgi:hypothetical protein